MLIWQFGRFRSNSLRQGRIIACCGDIPFFKEEGISLFIFKEEEKWKISIENIKEYLIDNEVNRKVKLYSVNKSDLDTYYNVGKELALAGKHYGDGIIKKFSERLKFDLGKGYSQRNLWLMLKFYEFQKMQTVSAHLSWSHSDERIAVRKYELIG